MYLITEYFIENNKQYTQDNVDDIYDKLWDYWLWVCIQEALEYVDK